MFCKNLHSRLLTFAKKAPPGGPNPELLLVWKCTLYWMDVIICSYREGPHEGYLVKFMSNTNPTDVVLWNAGVHFSIEANIHELPRVVEGALVEWNQSRHLLPQLFWRETSPQHFLHGVYEKSLKTKACFPPSTQSLLGNNVYNNLTEPVINKYNVPILRTYKSSLHLNMSSHYGQHLGDCTHFCPENFGPMNFELSLFARLLELSLNNLDSISQDMLTVERRWENLMVSNVSALAKSICANSKLSYDPKKDGILTCAEISCILRSNVILGKKKREEEKRMAQPGLIGCINASHCRDFGITSSDFARLDAGCTNT